MDGIGKRVADADDDADAHNQYLQRKAAALLVDRHGLGSFECANFSKKLLVHMPTTYILKGIGLSFWKERG
jgi:hypothetical protein